MSAPLTARPNASIEGQPQSGVERLFGRLAAMYGTKFADLWRGVDMADIKQAWAEALRGYTADEIMRGVNACMSRDWPPTLPEFARMCRPGLEPERAFQEAQEQMLRREDGRDKWSHPAIYWSAVQYGHFELRNDSWYTAKSRWESLLRDNLANTEIPPVPPRLSSLPAPGATTLTKAEAAERVQQIRQRTGQDMGRYLTGMAQAGQARNDLAYINRLRDTAKNDKGAHARKLAAEILIGWGYSLEPSADDVEKGAR